MSGSAGFNRFPGFIRLSGLKRKKNRAFFSNNRPHEQPWCVSNSRFKQFFFDGAHL